MSLVYAFIFSLFSWSRVGAEILAADFVFSQIVAIRVKFLSVPAVGFLVFLTTIMLSLWIWEEM